MDRLPDLSLLSHAEKDALIHTLRAQVQALTVRVVEWEAKLDLPPKTADNSSLPPSRGKKPNREDQPARTGPARAASVARVAVGGSPRWTSPLGVEGSLTNPNTPGGHHGREANPTELHAGVQGAGGRTAAGRRQGAVGGGDRAGAEHRPAEHVAHGAPGRGLGRGTGGAPGRGGGDAAAAARG